MAVWWRCLGCAGTWVTQGCLYLLQDTWVRLLEVVQGAEEASLDAGHVLPREVGVVLGLGFLCPATAAPRGGLPPCTGRALGRWGVGGRVRCGSRGLSLQGAQRDLPQPPVRGDPPGPLGPLFKAIHRPTKALVAAAD